MVKVAAITLANPPQTVRPLASLAFLAFLAFLASLAPWPAPDLPGISCTSQRSISPLGASGEIIGDNFRATEEVNKISP